MRSLILVVLFLVTGLAVLIPKVTMAATLERTIDVTSKEKNANIARRQLIDQAQTQAIEDMVRETLGSERFAKNKAVITNKILKLSSRLIPFSKAGNLEATPEGHRMSVLVRINVDDLDQLLIDQGLYFENDVQPLILPLIVWQDRKNDDDYAWWSSDSNAPLTGLSAWNAEFEKILRREFLEEGFYVLKPQQFRFHEASSVSGSTKLGASDVQAMTTQRQTQVALQGEIQVIHSSESGRELDIKLNVMHVPRNRILAQVGRRVPLEKNLRPGVISTKVRDLFDSIANDLANQTIEAWQRGATQSTAYKITVNGAMTPGMIEAFREGFKTKVREVKTLRERLITSTMVVFEMDSAISPKDLAQRVSEIDAKSAKIRLSEALSDELRFQVVK